MKRECICGTQMELSIDPETHERIWRCPNCGFVEKLDPKDEMRLTQSPPLPGFE